LYLSFCWGSSPLSPWIIFLTLWHCQGCLEPKNLNFCFFNVILNFLQVAPSQL
jgi:hypothetical protein